LRDRVKRDYGIKAINRYYHAHPQEGTLYTKEVAYMNSINKMVMCPYPFSEMYSKMPVDVEFDTEKDMHYINHKGKSLYFPRTMQIEEVIGTYRTLLLEQDVRNSHRYMTENIERILPLSFFDVGSAEGILALELIDRVDKVYLFESDPAWIDALNATFEPWKNKVTIVSKFAGSVTNETTVTIDEICKEDPNTKLIKMDVEGAELDVLKGCKKIIAEQGNVFLCCTYHRERDAEDFEKLFKEQGYRIEFTEGYIFLASDPTWEVGIYVTRPPFRRGLIRAWKE